MSVSPPRHHSHMELEAALAQMARCQLGLVTRRQALAAGLSLRGIRTRLARGDWLLVRRSVYALAGVRPTFEQAALAACLAVGNGCWASHRTAAALWELGLPTGPTIEVLTLPSQRVRLDGISQHRTIHLPMADLTRHCFVPVTSVARTVVDCLPHLTGRRLARVVDDALRRKLLTVAELAACTGRLDHGGGRTLVPMRGVLADRLPGYDPGANDRELGVVGVLLRGGLAAPVQQYRVVVDGRERFLDFAYPDEKVGLEFDGFAEHERIRSTFDDDRLRGNDLAVAGWLMLHFTSNSTPSHIVDRTAQALALRQRLPA